MPWFGELTTNHRPYGGCEQWSFRYIFVLYDKLYFEV